MLSSQYLPSFTLRCLILENQTLTFLFEKGPTVAEVNENEEDVNLSP